MSRKQFSHTYNDIISAENLLGAWREFLKGKRNRKDAQFFQYHLSDNILSLYDDLKSKTYQHGEYEAFSISDPKPRNIHKASVRDRVLHRALYRVLYPYFDRKFIHDSYSCRNGKGTHCALKRFTAYARVASKNHTRTLWVLKCDIRKFFASIDHDILVDIARKHILEEDTIQLVSEIVDSFYSAQRGIGLPLGNLTSQLFANVYLNELDQFMKHGVKAKYYIRYADDFVVMSDDKNWLESILPRIGNFLRRKLRLELHPDKVFIQTISSGVDFLGWVNFPNHRVLRTTTKKRMFRNIQRSKGKTEVVQAYLGLLKHGNTKKLQREIKVRLQTIQNNTRPCLY